jgi:hypothetical protein
MAIIIHHHHSGTWNVYKDQISSAALAVFSTKQEALAFALPQAVARQTALFQEDQNRRERIGGLFAPHVRYADPHLWDEDVEH